MHLLFNHSVFIDSKLIRMPAMTRTYGARTYYGPRRSNAQQSKRARRASYASPRYGYTTVPRTRGVYSKGEMKYFDSSVAQNPIVSSSNWTGTEQDPPTLNTLFVPTVGSAINQRIGREVKVMKIKIRGQIRTSTEQNQTVASPPTYVRLLLAQDEQTNAAQMQGEQLMTSGSGDSVRALTTFQNLDNFGRFRVLKDKIITLQDPNITYDGTNVEQNGLVRPFKMNVNFRKPVSVRFNATNGGSVADIVDNSFHVIANCFGTDGTPAITYSCRVCYKE